MKKIFVVNSKFFYCNLNSNNGLRHSIKSSLIALWNLLSFPVSQFVTSLEPPALTFYNLALFYIHGNDGTTILRRGVIQYKLKEISLKKGSKRNLVVGN